MEFDMAWLALGAVFLACGAVPAIMALAAERRRAPEARGFALRHECAGGLAPAEIRTIRLAVTIPAPCQAATWAGTARR